MRRTDAHTFPQRIPHGNKLSRQQPHAVGHACFPQHLFFHAPALYMHVFYRHGSGSFAVDFQKDIKDYGQIQKRPVRSVSEKIPVLFRIDQLEYNSVLYPFKFQKPAAVPRLISADVPVKLHEQINGLLYRPSLSVLIIVFLQINRGRYIYAGRLNNNAGPLCSIIFYCRIAGSFHTPFHFLIQIFLYRAYKLLIIHSSPFTARSIKFKREKRYELYL